MYDSHHIEKQFTEFINKLEEKTSLVIHLGGPEVEAEETSFLRLSERKVEASGVHQKHTQYLLTNYPSLWHTDVCRYPQKLGKLFMISC